MIEPNHSLKRTAVGYAAGSLQPSACGSRLARTLGTNVPRLCLTFECGGKEIEMGFWSTLGNAAKGAADRMAVASQEANVLAEEYRREDDEYLKRKLKNGNFTQKMAATKVLKERGYGSQD